VIELGKYPYILNTGKLREFFEKIPKMGVPSKITTRTLPTLGFKSTNDRPIISILKYVDFLDSSGTPNQNYKDFRDSTKAGSILATELKKSYSELFELYPNACDKDEKALKDFFAPTTDAGEQVVIATVSTFKVLCGFADFKGIAKGEEEEKGEDKQSKEESGGKPQPQATGVILNVNIQITLPETHDALVYDNIFKAIKNNLISRD
jgi:hypothetical protein